MREELPSAICSSQDLPEFQRKAEAHWGGARWCYKLKMDQGGCPSQVVALEFLWSLISIQILCCWSSIISLSPMLQRKIFRGSMVSGKTAEVFLSKQGTKSLNEYYQPYPTEIDIRKNQREDLKVVTFLVGLSSTYASTKEQLLTGTELPSLNVAFSSLSRIVVENEEPVEASRTQQ